MRRVHGLSLRVASLLLEFLVTLASSKSSFFEERPNILSEYVGIVVEFMLTYEEVSDWDEQYSIQDDENEFHKYGIELLSNFAYSIDKQILRDVVLSKIQSLASSNGWKERFCLFVLLKHTLDLFYSSSSSLEGEDDDGVEDDDASVTNHIHSFLQIMLVSLIDPHQNYLIKFAAIDCLLDYFNYEFTFPEYYYSIFISNIFQLILSPDNHQHPRLIGFAIYSLEFFASEDCIGIFQSPPDFPSPNVVWNGFSIPPILSIPSPFPPSSSIQFSTEELYLDFAFSNLLNIMNNSNHLYIIQSVISATSKLALYLSRSFVPVRIFLFLFLLFPFLFLFPFPFLFLFLFFLSLFFTPCFHSIISCSPCFSLSLSPWCLHASFPLASLFLLISFKPPSFPPLPSTPYFPSAWCAQN